jgi:hypothetical protein
MNPIRRIRRLAAVLAGLAVALLTPQLAAALGSTHPGAASDSGLVACAYPLSTHEITAADYRHIRARFAGSRWPDLRTAGTDYVDLAVQLLTARGTDGYETVWSYRRLSAACARHGRPLPWPQTSGPARCSAADAPRADPPGYGQKPQTATARARPLA